MATLRAIGEDPRRPPAPPRHAISVRVDKAPDIEAALRDLEAGSFNRPAALARQIYTDDRAGAVIRTRVNGLVGKRLQVLPPPGRASTKRIEAALREDLPRIWPAPEAYTFTRLALMLAAAPAVMDWDVSGARYIPRLRHWDPALMRYNYARGYYEIQTLAGGLVPLPTSEDGDGLWLLYEPFGARAWEVGEGVVNPMSDPYLARAWARRDAQRYSEVHGQPTTLADTPYSDSDDRASATAKGEFLDDLYERGSNAVVRCPKVIDPATGKEIGYNVRYLEATAKTHEVFFAIQDREADSLAITALGGNTSTFAEQGSHALAGVQDLIRSDLQVWDAVAEMVILRVVVRWWALWNFGDADLAPIVVREIPADIIARAKQMGTVGEALGKLRAAGVNVDVDLEAREAGVRLRDASSDSEDPEDTTDTADMEDEMSDTTDQADAMDPSQTAAVPGAAVPAEKIPITPTDAAAAFRLDEVRADYGRAPVGGAEGQRWLAEHSAMIRADAAPEIAEVAKAEQGRAPDAPKPDAPAEEVAP